jgi:hypothetical protein
MPYEKPSPSKVVEFFKIFYNSFTKDTCIRYAYEEEAKHFRQPTFFNLSKVCEPDNPGKKIFQIMYMPCPLLVNFCSGRNCQTRGHGAMYIT